MIKLLRFLITGSFHEHVWEIYKEVAVYSGSKLVPEELPLYKKIVCKCKTCGAIKVFKT